MPRSLTHTLATILDQQEVDWAAAVQAVNILHQTLTHHLEVVNASKNAREMHEFTHAKVSRQEIDEAMKEHYHV